jgi:DNA-binding NarL/FixJ family response regulator
MSTSIRYFNGVKPLHNLNGAPGQEICSTKDSARTPTRVFIVDRHELVRCTLRDLLQKEPDVEVCGESDGGPDAFDQLTAASANFVTVDIPLTGEGLTLIESIHRTKPATRILAISMYGHGEFTERAINAGALGFVSKRSSNLEILEAFRRVRNGKLYPRSSAIHKSAYKHLSNRELHVLCLIGNGASTHDIATGLQLADSTVETYRERLKQKLSLATNAELIRHATIWVMQNPGWNRPMPTAVVADLHA